jgi:hypothetical protein
MMMNSMMCCGLHVCFLVVLTGCLPHLHAMFFLVSFAQIDLHHQSSVLLLHFNLIWVYHFLLLLFSHRNSQFLSNSKFVIIASQSLSHDLRTTVTTPISSLLFLFLSFIHTYT